MTNVVKDKNNRICSKLCKRLTIILSCILSLIPSFCTLKVNEDNIASFVSFLLKDSNEATLSSTPFYTIAMNWIEEFNTPFRTLDALHLAIAAQNNALLLTADSKFAESAEKLGIEVTFIS